MNENFNSYNNGTNNSYGQQNPYGQQSPYGYGNYNEEFFLREQEKKKDKKIIKSIGKTVANSVTFYLVMAVAAALILGLILDAFPEYRVLILNFVSFSGISNVETMLFLGLPFFIGYLMMKKKKITGLLPLGTPYNGKSSVFLCMFMLPVVLFSTVAVNYISFLIQSLAGIEFESGLENITFSGVTEITMAVISLAILPAIIEEIIVRGIILQPLRRYGDWFAIIISALIFSLLHGNMVQIPYTFLGGIYFGFVAVATGSIWPTIILHFLNNLFSVVVTAVETAFGTNVANIVVISIFAVLLIVCVVGIILYKKSNYKVKFAKGVNTLKLNEKLKAFFVNVPMVIAGVLILIQVVGSIKK